MHSPRSFGNGSWAGLDLFVGGCTALVVLYVGGRMWGIVVVTWGGVKEEDTLAKVVKGVVLKL